MLSKQFGMDFQRDDPDTLISFVSPTRFRGKGLRARHTAPRSSGFPVFWNCIGGMEDEYVSAVTCVVEGGSRSIIVTEEEPVAT